MIKKREDEESEDFELIPSINEEEESSKGIEDRNTEKEQRAEMTSIALKVMLIDAGENEDIFYGQHQAIAEKLEDLY